jgi:hypothetical protein
MKNSLLIGGGILVALLAIFYMFTKSQAMAAANPVISQSNQNASGFASIATSVLSNSNAMDSISSALGQISGGDGSDDDGCC